MRKQLLEFIHQYLSDEEVKFLAKGWTAVRLLGTLVFVICFVSCESYVEYNGPRDPEKLVVLSAELEPNHSPYIILSHTYFFLDTKKNKDVSYVTDATVRMRINGGEWFPLSCTGRHIYYSVPDSVTTMLAADDIVDMEASHDTYGTITATQRVPHYADVSVPDYHITKDGWVMMDLQIGAYQGDTTDVIAISDVTGAISYSEQLADSLIRDTARLQFLYSQDAIFGLLDNKRTPHGYYYDDLITKDLYIPASTLREPRTISFFADRYDIDGSETIKDVQLEELNIFVHVMTRDMYLYEKSTAKVIESSQYLSSFYVREPSGIESDATDIYDIVQGYIDGMSSVLGGQEGTQVYTNVANGVGCFGARTTRTIDVVKRKID